MKTNNTDTLKVLIVGCGNIAGDLDLEGYGGKSFPLTHAGAYTQNKDFNILACVDISKSKSEKFAARWNIPKAYNDIEQAIQSGEDYDVVSICSPTDCHYSDIIACLSLSPKLIFCEKPVTVSVQDTLKIKAACDSAGILLAVNYSRRWDEYVLKLKKEIETDQRGPLRSVVGYYNKGILNNGSHLLDLLDFLIGEMTIKHVGRADYDFFSNDPSICVTLETEANVPILLVPASKAGDFSIFEIHMVFSNGMLQMLDGGLRWFEKTVTDSPVFDGYRVLDKGTINQGGYSMAMTNAVINISNTLKRKEALNSSIDTAIKSHTLCENILTSCKN